jgi:hypothetical protein
MGVSATKAPPPCSHAEMRQHLVDESKSDYMKDFYAERPFTKDDWKWFFKSDEGKKNMLDQQIKEYWAHYALELVTPAGKNCV